MESQKYDNLEHYSVTATPDFLMIVYVIKNIIKIDDS